MLRDSGFANQPEFRIPDPEFRHFFPVAPERPFCYFSCMANRRGPTKSQSPYGQAGYPAVEKLIDTEDFDELNEAFEAAYAELFEISRKKKGLKARRDAKKAMKALELTLDLFRELLAIKYKLQEEAEKAQRS